MSSSKQQLLFHMLFLQLKPLLWWVMEGGSRCSLLGWAVDSHLFSTFWLVRFSINYHLVHIAASDHSRKQHWFVGISIFRRQVDTCPFSRTKVGPIISPTEFLSRFILPGIHFFSFRTGLKSNEEVLGYLHNGHNVIVSVGTACPAGRFSSLMVSQIRPLVLLPSILHSTFGTMKTSQQRWKFPIWFLYVLKLRYVWSFQ